MQKIFIIVIFFIISNTGSSSELDFQSYQAATFSEIEHIHGAELLKSSKKNEYVVSAATFKYVIPVTFIKELRKLSRHNKTVIKAWQSTLRVPADFVDRYQHEFKAEFGNEVVWIPVQESLLLPMSSELHPGDMFKLFVVLIGAKDGKLVMLATEFKSDRAPL